MRFVPVKSEAQSDIQAMHSPRSRLVAERTALINHLRGASPRIPNTTNHAFFRRGSTVSSSADFALTVGPRNSYFSTSNKEGSTKLIRSSGWKPNTFSNFSGPRRRAASSRRCWFREFSISAGGGAEPGICCATKL